MTTEAAVMTEFVISRLKDTLVA